MHPDWLHFARGQQDAGGALLNQQSHTSEQVGCRAEQGELDLQGHCPSVQPATWMQEIQFGCSIRPDDDDDGGYRQEIFLKICQIMIVSTASVSVWLSLCAA